MSQFFFFRERDVQIIPILKMAGEEHIFSSQSMVAKKLGQSTLLCSQEHERFIFQEQKFLSPEASH